MQRKVSGREHINLFCILPHGFSSKRETACSLTGILYSPQFRSHQETEIHIYDRTEKWGTVDSLKTWRVQKDEMCFYATNQQKQWYNSVIHA